MRRKKIGYSTDMHHTLWPLVVYDDAGAGNPAGGADPWGKKAMNLKRLPRCAGETSFSHAETRMSASALLLHLPSRA